MLRLHNRRNPWRSKLCFCCLLLASSVVNGDVSCPDSASLFVLAGPCLFCWLRILFFPTNVWELLITWSYLLLLSPRSCFGSLWRGVPPKGAGCTDLRANKGATGEVTETIGSKNKVDSWWWLFWSWTRFSSVTLCLSVFLALMGQRDESETKACILNGLCLQPQGIGLTS